MRYPFTRGLAALALMFAAACSGGGHPTEPQQESHVQADLSESAFVELYGSEAKGWYGLYTNLSTEAAGEFYANGGELTANIGCAVLGTAPDAVAPTATSASEYTFSLFGGSTTLRLMRKTTGCSDPGDPGNPGNPGLGNLSLAPLQGAEVGAMVENSAVKVTRVQHQGQAANEVWIHIACKRSIEGAQVVKNVLGFSCAAGERITWKLAASLADDEIEFTDTQSALALSHSVSPGGGFNSAIIVGQTATFQGGNALGTYQANLLPAQAANVSTIAVFEEGIEDPVVILDFSPGAAYRFALKPGANRSVFNNAGAGLRLSKRGETRPAFDDAG